MLWCHKSAGKVSQTLRRRHHLPHNGTAGRCQASGNLRNECTITHHPSRINHNCATTYSGTGSEWIVFPDVNIDFLITFEFEEILPINIFQVQVIIARDIQRNTYLALRDRHMRVLGVVCLDYIMHNACMQAIRNLARHVHNPHLDRGHLVHTLRDRMMHRCQMCSRDRSRRTWLVEIL